MQPARRSRMLGILVSLATVLIFFAVAEAAFRVYLFHFASRERKSEWLRVEDMPADALRFESHPYTCYALNPRFRSDDGLDRHNSLGFRGEEIAMAKPPGVVRIACIGGSSTYDTEIASYEEAYPAQLERVLREDYGRSVEVINAGVPGYTTFESLVQLEMRVLPMQPDLLIVVDVVNDVHARLVPPERYRPDNTGYRHAWTERAHGWERSLLLRAIGVQTRISQRNNVREWTKEQSERPEEELRADWLVANPPVYFRSNVESMIALARRRSCDVLVLSWPHSPSKNDYASTPAYRTAFAEHNAILRDIAQAQSAPFFDLAAEMPQDPQYWEDGRHNTAKGARIKAERIARYIVENNLL